MSASDAEYPCRFDYLDRACDPEVLCPSLDDKMAEECMKESCTFTKDHYEIGLTWKHGCPDLSNNYEMVLAHLESLGRRLKADSELWDNYRAKIHDMVLKGHFLKVPEDSKCNELRVWYISRHCVTSKFRVGTYKWDLFAILSKKNKAKMLVNILLKRFAFTLKASSVK